MGFAPVLRPGLEAYRRGNYASALSAWQRPWLVLAGDEKALCRALVRLAMAGLQERVSGAAQAAALRRAATLDLIPLPDILLGVDVTTLRQDLISGTPPFRLRSKRRWLSGAALRFFAFILLLAVSAALLRWTPLHRFLDKQVLVAMLEQLRLSWWAPLVLIGLFMVASPLGLPISPLIVTGGVVFGVVHGALYNALGAILGAALSFGLARFLGRDFVVQIAGKRLRRVESLAQRHSFWGLVGIRVVPVPFPVVNFGLALAGVSFTTFIVTSAIGLTPSMIIYTYLFATVVLQVAQGPSRTQLIHVAIVWTLVILVGLSPTIWQQVQRRRRYRQILALRRQRRQG